MTNAVIPRQLGDDYQARWFWMEATRLFHSESRVSEVGYEHAAIKSFDDVVTFYGVPVPDSRGGMIEADYFQVKFNTRYAGGFSWEGLKDPSLIGADSISLLQKLQAAQIHASQTGKRALFRIISPKSFVTDDPLASLRTPQSGAIRLDDLFDGTSSRSAMGKLRASWKDHLGLADDDALLEVITPLRLRLNAPDFETLRDDLDVRLRLAGLRPGDRAQIGYPYDDLIRKLHAAGHVLFTGADLQDWCEREGLWLGRPDTIPTDGVHLGIRSFLRFAEHMEDETEHLLDLVEHFDERPIRDPESWQQLIFPKLNEFLYQHVDRRRGPYYLHLDTHASIAFTAGYCLDPKLGVEVIPVQRTRTATSYWTRSTGANPTESLWERRDIQIRADAPDVGVAVSVTQDTIPAALRTAGAIPGLGRMFTYTVRPGIGGASVRDGSHAQQLVDSLVAGIREDRENLGVDGRLHIFIAAPNGLVFFLGQSARALGPCTMYEYPFGAAPSTSQYVASLSFPSDQTGKGV